MGEVPFIKKYIRESTFVNGCRVSGACSADGEFLRSLDVELKTDDYDKLLDCSDAVYVASHPSLHYEQIKKAIEKETCYTVGEVNVSVVSIIVDETDDTPVIVHDFDDEETDDVAKSEEENA